MAAIEVSGAAADRDEVETEKELLPRLASRPLSRVIDERLEPSAELDSNGCGVVQDRHSPMVART